MMPNDKKEKNTWSEGLVQGGPFIFKCINKIIRKSQESRSSLNRKKTNQKITRMPFIFNGTKNESENHKNPIHF